MYKILALCLGMIIGSTLYAQDPVYILEFENPTLNETSMSWDVRIRAASADFTLLSGNIRYNFNNSGLTTTTNPTFTVTHPSFVLDNTSFLGTAPNRYVNLAFSSPGAGAVINGTGIIIGTVTQLKMPSLATGTLADIRIRAWNVPGYVNYLPAATANNSTRIFTQDSPFTPVQAGTPVNLDPNFILPVVIKHFSAEKVGEKEARLYWTSTSEINASHYEIERSDDAENFTTIGEVKAVGNSSTHINYEFFDKNILVLRSQTIVYYRLKMVDLDAKYDYSDIRGLNFNRNELDGILMYPNPTNQWLNIDVSGLDFENENAELSIYGMDGKLLLSKNIIGAGIETVDMGRFSAGMYHVLLKQGDNLYREKVIRIE